MKYNIRGKKVDITDSIKTYIEEKIGKLDKYFEKPEDILATVLVKIKGHEQIVEVTITNGVTLRGEESHKDLYAAIDLVLEKIERQIRKNKTRLKKRKNKDKSLDFVIDFDTEEDEEKQITKRKSIEMKPMNEEEAILQMNLLDHDFFVYKDIDTEKICVLYKRKDGDYGIIESN